MKRGWMGLLVLLAGCGEDTSGGGESGTGPGASTPLPWVDTVGSGTGDAGDTPLPWVDSGTATPGEPPIDATDIRTYTSPDIYILGNRHPLMTEVTIRTHPSIIGPENRVLLVLNEFRYSEYVRLIGSPLPPNARLIESQLLRQNARAHAKHYAVWIPDTPLPLVNLYGDSVWYSNPIPGPGIELLPNLSSVTGARSGRLPRSRVTVDLVGQLVASGTEYRDADVLARHWIDTYPDFIRHSAWTHIGVGYWRTIGTGIDHYWNAVFAKNPRHDEITLPPLPINRF